MANEVLQRVRRIETRLTQAMVALGIPTDTQKPIFKMVDVPGEDQEVAVLDLPSPHSSMKEILDSIPPKWDGPVEVFVGYDKVCTIGRAST